MCYMGKGELCGQMNRRGTQISGPVGLRPRWREYAPIATRPFTEGIYPMMEKNT